MNTLQQILTKATESLNELDLSFALVGGLAVSARVEPRFTRDVDLVVAVDDDRHAESTVRALLGSGYHLLATVEQQQTGRMATVRLLPPGEGPEGIVLDILFASSGIEPEVAAAAQPLEVFLGAEIPVATVAHLIALKVLSRDPSRPQDHVDLVALLGVACESDFEEVSKALDLINIRGANRGRDLHQILAELRAS